MAVAGSRVRYSMTRTLNRALAGALVFSLPGARQTTCRALRLLPWNEHGTDTDDLPRPMLSLHSLNPYDVTCRFRRLRSRSRKYFLRLHTSDRTEETPETEWSICGLSMQLRCQTSQMRTYVLEMGLTIQKLVKCLTRFVIV